jgi:hypothetical protein
LQIFFLFFAFMSCLKNDRQLKVEGRAQSKCKSMLFCITRYIHRIDSKMVIREAACFHIIENTGAIRAALFRFSMVSCLRGIVTSAKQVV